MLESLEIRNGANEIVAEFSTLQDAVDWWLYDGGRASDRLGGDRLGGSEPMVNVDAVVRPGVRYRFDGDGCVVGLD